MNPCLTTGWLGPWNPGTLERLNTGTFFNAIIKIEIDIKGATGFDGGCEVQVACRGAVTTLKGSTNTNANSELALAA